MADLQLDWSTAEVSGAVLKVSLNDKPSDEWSASFERTLRLLDRGTWPEISLKKRSVTVDGVQEGSEEKLRFFLDSVVQEANGETSADEEPEDSGSEDSESEDDDEESQNEQDPDQEMTERFRAFASSEDEEGSV